MTTSIPSSNLSIALRTCLCTQPPVFSNDLTLIMTILTSASAVWYIVHDYSDFPVRDPAALALSACNSQLIVLIVRASRPAYDMVDLLPPPAITLAHSRFYWHATAGSKVALMHMQLSPFNHLEHTIVYSANTSGTGILWPLVQDGIWQRMRKVYTSNSNLQ